jgi:hypothetical protein
VRSDILRAVDRGDIAALLDLSAAFDSVDHATLVRRLFDVSFILSGTVLLWFESYLRNRFQCVWRGNSSAPSLVTCDVLQRSVVGPIVFLLYAVDVLHIIDSHSFIPQIFADDLQI